MFTEDDIFTVAVRQALREKAFTHAAKAIGTTKDLIQTEFFAALHNGESIQQLAQRIDTLFGKTTGYRSKLIARTELTGVINDGTVRTLTTEGFQEKKWSTVIDGRERPAHAEANGQTVSIHQPFIIGGSPGMYPGDPNLPISQTAQCRCTVVGAGVPVDRVKALGEEFLRLHGTLENRFVVYLRRAFSAQRDRILSTLPS